MMRTRAILQLVLCLLGAMLGRGAQASIQHAQEPIAMAIGRLPRSAEMVVVIDGMGAVRDSSAGAALTGVLDDVGLLEWLAPKWQALGVQLGWSAQEAFDRLIGTRVALVMSGLETGQSVRWAVLCEVSVLTDEHIKTHVTIVPRKAVEGRQIFAIERGQYELATFRVGVDQDRVLLLLGPAERPEMFNQLAKALSRPNGGDALATTPVIAEVAAHGDAGIVLAARIDPEDEVVAKAQAPWSNFVVCSAKARGRAWECRLTMRDVELAPQLGKIAETSDAPYRAMSRGAILAVLETRLSGQPADPKTALGKLASMVALPTQASELLTGRQALAVWPRFPVKPVEGIGTTPVCVAVALETSDINKLAGIGDKYVSELVSSIEKGLGGAGAPPPDFTGIACQAVRTVNVEAPKGNLLHSVFDAPTSVAWSYPPTPPGPIAKDGPAETSSSGWWQVCVSGGTFGSPQPGKEADLCANLPGGAGCADAARQVTQALTTVPAGGETKRWLSLGTVRPSAWSPILQQFAGGVTRIVPKADTLFKLLGRMDSLEWRLAVDDRNDIVGTVRLDMAATPAK